MDQMSASHQGPTKVRSLRAFQSTAGDFLQLLNEGTVSTHHFLRRAHNLALGLGWISAAVLPPKLWPKPQFRDKRALTAPEYQRIVAAEKNPERSLYYRLLWEIGAAQSRAAALTA